jgi:hypothetical protein
MKDRTPVMRKKCPTCPFSEEGWSEVRELLEQRVLSEGSPVCHSTGPGAISEKTLCKQDRLCRGARDFALSILAGSGFLDAPTDAAWEAKAAELDL